ncbi:MAG: flagellar basal-body MS-ring/collar protein FliF [Pseudomonadota bacterium]
MADTNTSSNPLAQALGRLNNQQRIGLMVAVAAIIALVVGLWTWGQTPDYRVLYSNLSDRDGGAIIESLQQMNVPYKFAEGGGALLVPSSQVHEVRLRLASQGLPKGGTVGFELMENQKFGTSQFQEQVNYQRGLEGELARSMQTLASVQAARVHLAIPKPSVFVKEQIKPSASVVLTLHAGRSIDPGQVNAIVHLISSSVPEMPAKNVTVVDQSGNLLSAVHENGQELLDATQLKYVRQIEQDYIKRIEDILAPITGQDNIRAQVTADIDFSQIEQTSETYKPNQTPGEAAVRSTQSMESLNNSGQGANGVPGALSNQPPVPATAPIVSPASAVASSPNSGSVNTRKEATTNYEVDKTIRHTKLPVGNIKRLSVAVVVNNRTVTEKNGKTSSRPLTDSEKAQINDLVKQAVGFDGTRGDSLNILNSAFNDEKASTEEPPLWKQPGMMELVKEILKYVLIAGAMLFLLFGIIRPAFRNLAPPAPAVPEGGTTGEGGAGGEHGVVPDDAAAQYALQMSNVYENHLQVARQLVQQEPRIVASVLKEWMGTE